MSKKEWIQKIDMYKPREIKDMVYSAVILGIAFNIGIFGRENPFEFIREWYFFFYFVPTFLIVLVSLFIKDYSQKNIAKHLESFVRFEMWVPGGVIAFLSSFLGIVVAAVGGVKASADYRSRYGRWIVNMTSQQLGLIAMSGIFTYIFLALLFVLLAPTVPIYVMGNNLFMVGFEINLMLSIFSLVPIKPLDGENLLRWSVFMWLSLLVMSLVIFFIV